MLYSNVMALSLAVAGVSLNYSSAMAQESNADPLEVAPFEFRHLLSNEFVRVLHVTVEDGTKTPFHGHPHRVVVFLTDCVWVDEAEDGSTVKETYRKGEVVWIEAMVHGGANRVEDTCELVEIELK